MSLLQDAYTEAQSQWRAIEQSDRPVFRVGTATCGLAAGAADVLERLRKEIKSHGLAADVIEVGCLGTCFIEPLVIVQKPGFSGVCYGAVGPEEMAAILERFILGDDPCAEWALGKIAPGPPDQIAMLDEHRVMRGQVRNVLRNCGLIDPENMSHYLARDGYRGFLRAIQIGPEAVLEQVKASRLCGRGGAGFPTWRKWATCRAEPAQQKYLICNADEGDPGAFMNRSLLESDPHSMLEGMLIAGFAIGASNGYVYCRAEYPLAVRRVELAVAGMRELGLLGEDICGSGFSFDIEIKKGAGAFVCGEETALIAAIEGRRGMPCPRPPFPAVRGLRGKPTIIQNVETLGNLPNILRNGADWFTQWGTESSRGTKTFALAGKVRQTGLIEVPLGTTLKQIVYDIGGGVPEGKSLKAVQTGGPSGGCIPADKMDLPVDYESLAKAGSIMGSGGMVVLDEDTCAVDIARYFLTFTQAESCGKCPPCRVGTRAMLAILDRICEGRGRHSDLARLESLSQTIKKGSLCGLGQTAPNPVLTTLRYFRGEYEQHIREGRCHAGVCEKLVASPCQNECPAGVDVPLYLSLVREGRLEEALASHLERNPLPAVCSRVCPHPCETKCRRLQLDSPVDIRSIKRYMVDNANRVDPMTMVRENPHNRQKKVAVVGAGPAGLTCAYFLRRMGYPVTIFEKEDRPGGMMAVIPEHRLPRDVLQKDIDWLLGTGIELSLNTEVGKDITLEQLKAEGYRAVFLAPGAGEGMTLGVPGEDLDGVTQGLDFLAACAKGRDFPVGKNVVVVGGGDVAVDSACVARRLGAEVTIVYRRTRDEMPAIDSEIEQAQAEGVKFIFLALPERIEGQGGRAGKVICRRMRLGEYGLDGRRRPEETEELFEVEADTVVAAIGQRPVTKTIAEHAGITVTRSRRIPVDSFTNETDVPMIFAGGDVVTGPNIILSAVEAGQRGARAINEKLSQDVPPDERSEPFWERTIVNDTPFDPLAEPVDTPRMSHKRLPSEARSGFVEVELPVDGEVAIKECERCLRCDCRIED